MADALLIALGYTAVAGTVFVFVLAVCAIPWVIASHWSPIYPEPRR